MLYITRNIYRISFCNNSVIKLDKWEAKLKLVAENDIPNQPRIRLFTMDRQLNMIIAKNSKLYTLYDWEMKR